MSASSKLFRICVAGSRASRNSKARVTRLSGVSAGARLQRSRSDALTRTLWRLGPPLPETSTWHSQPRWVGTASTLIMEVMVLARDLIVSPPPPLPPGTRAGLAELLQAYADMSVSRGIEDIERSLVHHSHDHPPVRDLNREADRRLSGLQRVAWALV